MVTFKDIIRAIKSQNENERLFRLYSNSHNLALLVHGQERRQNGSNVFTDHIRDVEITAGICIPHQILHYEIRAAALLHDIFEKLFTERIKTLEKRIEVNKFAKHLKKDYGYSGDNVCYIANKISSDKDLTGLADISHITHIKAQTKEQLINDILTVVLKICDNYSNNKPEERHESQSERTFFIGKRIRKGLEFLEFSYPIYVDILDRYQGLTLDNIPIFDYDITASVLVNTYENIQHFLQNSNVEKTIIKNSGIGYLNGNEQFYVSALHKFMKTHPELFKKSPKYLEEIMLKGGS